MLKDLLFKTKRKRLATALVCTVLLLAITSYILSSFAEQNDVRFPASFTEDYEKLSGCEKQQVLWQNVQDSQYKGKLPPFRDFGMFKMIAMGRQEVGLKGTRYSDFAPIGWKKYLHARGVLAKAKIVPKGGNYTGIFQGADCALIRLSITFKPGMMTDVAPGLALKILRDSHPSANVSALVSLTGQEKDYNFFKHQMSNIVPIVDNFGAKRVHAIFSSATDYPEELLADDMAGIDAKGSVVENAVSPRQLFFVPGPNLQFDSAEHDIREDILKIPTGTVLYHIHAASDELKNFNYVDYKDTDVAKFLADSRYIADIVTDSEFTASSFGDEGIFFRHQIRPKTKK